MRMNTGAHWWRWILRLFLLLCLFQPAHAVLHLERQSAVELAGHLEMLEDSADGFTIEQVKSGQAGRFQTLSAHLNEGFGAKRGVWLRFTLRAGPNAPRQWYLRVFPAYLRQVDLYLPTAAGEPERVLRGGIAPAPPGSLPERSSLFPIELKPGEARRFYLYVKHDHLLRAYPVLLTAEGLRRALSRENLLFGLYFGIVLVLIFVNGLNGYVLREPIYAVFVFYLLCRGGGFFIALGYFNLFFSPAEPETVLEWFRLTVGLSVATTATFIVHILDMQRLYPRLSRIYYALGAVAAALGIGLYFGFFGRFVGLLALIALFLNLTALGVALTRVYAGRSYAWLSLLLMLLFSSGPLLSFSASLGLQYSLKVDLYSIPLSSAVTFMLLNVFVTLRVKEIKQAKADSDQAAHSAAQAAERERRARREQADFVSMLFHEIKTPLAVIDSAATVLEHLDNGGRVESGPRYEAIHRAVERLNHLVEQSLAHDRQGLDAAHLKCENIDLGALAEIVLDSFQSIGGGRLKLEAASALPAVRGDPELLRIAAANLLDNALKYSPRDGEIRLAVQSRGDSVELSVSDQGEGMDEESAARVFAPYQRGRRTAGTSGAGLGLYLVRRIAEAHNGTVRVETRPRQGCRFTLQLPPAMDLKNA